MQSRSGIACTARLTTRVAHCHAAAIRPDPSRKSAVQYRIYCALHSAAQQASRSVGQLGRDGVCWPMSD